MASVPAPILVDRVDIHKSCKSLEAIVSVLANYTEAANAMAAVEKKLAKALKEATSVKGTNHVPANAMMTSAGIFEALAEVDTKFAKIADKEAENVGNDLKKWFKKLTKEEKAHDERITNANARIKQAGQAYEKKAKKKDRDAADEHSRYVALLSSVGPEMSQDKHNHSLFVTQRHTMALSGFAATLSRLAEAEWTRACEHVRRSAPSIGNVSEWRVLCEGGWSGPVPGDLPDLGTVEYERDGRINDNADKSHDAMRTLMLPQPTGAAAEPAAYASEYLESPTSLSNPKPPASSTGRSSEGHSVAEHSSSNTMPSRPPSPPSTQVSHNTPKKRSARFDSANGPSLPSPVTQPAAQARSTSGTSSVGSPANARPAITATPIPDPAPVLTGDANSLHLPNGDGVAMPQDGRRLVGQDPDPEGTIKADTKANHPPLSPDLPPPFSNRDSFAGERNQAVITKKVDFADEREREVKIAAPSPVDTRPSGNGRNVGNLDRRLSVESTMSNNSLVATMRDRYDVRPVKPSSPPPRDLPRLAQSVTDLATRYTPVDTPISLPRSGPPSSQSGPSGDRFPTFQDRHPRTVGDRSDRDRDRHRALPESPAPDQDYFEDRDRERYRYAEAPAVDRNRFLRDDRDRERYRMARPRSPDRHYPDELGMRDRQRRIDTVEELALQEREENLREQERQLDMERARLASAREAGYGSDTGRSPRGGNPYGMPRRSESPGPMTSQQSLRPPLAAPAYDHSPSCGCQRCSAQHYASSTPSLPRTRRDSAAPEQPPIYKPEPPIQLRPEKPKNWIRRMSMPVASLVSSNDKKSPGVSSASAQNWTNMALPEEDGRVMRRSFELERDREAAARFGGTTRR